MSNHKQTPAQRFFNTHHPLCAVHVYSGDRRCSCGRDEALKEFERLQEVERSIMDDNFAFWFPITYIEQLTFENQTIKIEKFEDGHIVYGGRLMCGESREVILNHLHTKESKTLKRRPEHLKLCKECDHKYRMNGHSAYHAWVNGEAIKPVADLPKLIKA